MLSQLAPVSVRLAGGARNNATVAVQIKPKDRIAVLRATVASCTFCPDGKTSDMGANSPDMCYVSTALRSMLRQKRQRSSRCVSVHSRSQQPPRVACASTCS